MFSVSKPDFQAKALAAKASASKALARARLICLLETGSGFFQRPAICF